MGDTAGYVFGGMEAGGTKFVCIVGTGPHDIRATTHFETSGPSETIDRAADFFDRARKDGLELRAIGIGSFGPLELRRGHPRYGHITVTPKPGWSGVDVVGPIRRALDLPVGFDSDVNAAALAEGRWGEARGLPTFVYLTVGTGIGGGVVVNGRIAHGLVHPEIGHVVIGRDPADDSPSVCPFHPDCLEGLASGTAIRARWGRPAESLTGGDLSRAVELESSYLAQGLRTIVYAIAPERIIIGGGVSSMPGLLARTQTRLVEVLGGYPGLSEHEGFGFVVAASLGFMAGPAGALILAERAAEEFSPPSGRRIP